MLGFFDPSVLLNSVLYAGVGVVVFTLAFLLMVRLAPFSVKKELEEDQNIALAIIMGSVLLGLAIIIASAVHGA
jgi:putative membrane protein